MPLLQAKCPNCAGELEVDNTKDAWICPFCNTPFIVEKAINNYNITNHISAQNVEVYAGKASMEELLEREQTLKQLDDMSRLEQVYKDMQNYYPTKHNGWWGEIYIITRRFSLYTKFNYNDTLVPKTAEINSYIEKLERLFNLCMLYAPEEEKEFLKRAFYKYLLRVRNAQKKKLEYDLKKSNDDLISDKMNHAKSLSNQSDKLKKIMKDDKKQYDKKTLVVIIWLLFSAIAGFLVVNCIYDIIQESKNAGHFHFEFSMVEILVVVLFFPIICFAIVEISSSGFFKIRKSYKKSKTNYNLSRRGIDDTYKSEYESEIKKINNELTAIHMEMERLNTLLGEI